MEEEISLVELFGIIKKNFRYIVLATLATTVIAALYTMVFSLEDCVTSISVVDWYIGVTKNKV